MLVFWFWLFKLFVYSCLLFKYFRFELFLIIFFFLLVFVEYLVTRMLFTMQTKIQGFKMEKRIFLLIHMQFEIHIAYKITRFVCPLSSGGYQWKCSLL